MILGREGLEELVPGWKERLLQTDNFRNRNSLWEDPWVILNKLSEVKEMVLLNHSIAIKLQQTLNKLMVDSAFLRGTLMQFSANSNVKILESETAQWVDEVSMKNTKCFSKCCDASKKVELVEVAIQVEELKELRHNNSQTDVSPGKEQIKTMEVVQDEEWKELKEEFSQTEGSLEKLKDSLQKEISEYIGSQNIVSLEHQCKILKVEELAKEDCNIAVVNDQAEVDPEEIIVSRWVNQVKKEKE